MNAPDALAARLAELSAPLEPQSTGVEPRVARLGGIRAVVFDVYGTLFISASGDVGTVAGQHRTEAAGDALRAMGWPADVERAEQCVDRFLEGIEHDHAMRRAADVEFPEIEIRDIWRTALEAIVPEPTDDAIARFAIEYECRVNPVWPMPHLTDMLDALRASPLHLGIVSNAQFFTPLLFPAFLRGDAAACGFETPLSVWSYRLREAKPSQRLYRDLLAALREHHGIEPRQVLYVGNDMRNDIAPADALGIRTALFAGDRRSLRQREGDSMCEGVTPDITITDLLQLREVLDLSAA